MSDFDIFYFRSLIGNELIQIDGFKNFQTPENMNSKAVCLEGSVDTYKNYIQKCRFLFYKYDDLCVKNKLNNPKVTTATYIVETVNKLFPPLKKYSVKVSEENEVCLYRNLCLQNIYTFEQGKIISDRLKQRGEIDSALNEDFENTPPSIDNGLGVFGSNPQILKKMYSKFNELDRKVKKIGFDKNDKDLGFDDQVSSIRKHKKLVDGIVKVSWM